MGKSHHVSPDAPRRTGAKTPDAAVVRDVIAECERRGLPNPEVELLELNAGPNGGGLAARMRLRFTVAVAGPIMLGRDSHKGGRPLRYCGRRNLRRTLGHPMTTTTNSPRPAPAASRCEHSAHPGSHGQRMGLLPAVGTSASLKPSL